MNLYIIGVSILEYLATYSTLKSLFNKLENRLKVDRKTKKQTDKIVLSDVKKNLLSLVTM